MTMMLEKMAQAIWTQLPQDDANMATSNRIARAALQAIREVEERGAVFYAGLNAMAGYNDSGPGEPWTAMIDAILEGKA